MDRSGGACPGPALLRAGRGLDELLRLALATSGAERAYVAIRDAPGTEVGVVAMACAGDESARPVSHTVLHQVLGSDRSLVCLDASDSARFAAGRSVRRLALRSVAAAALPASSGSREGALVLDSRFIAGAPVDYLRTLVEGLAHLAGLLLTREPGTDVPGSRGDPIPRVAPETGRPQLEDWIRRIAPAELPVLIHGETGSGKERVAADLHRLGRRARGPLIAVNCAAFTETLLDAELFGAVRGAYTGADRDRAGVFQRADGGTLFLDEVGDMPRAMQAKLLRVLENGRVLPVGAARERAVDVRLVAATHRNLRVQVAREAFRADLFHRLAVLEVHVPPLRDRPGDLPRLVSALGPRLAKEAGVGVPRLEACAWEALAAHAWPGNVRELHAVLARALLRSEGGPILAVHLGLAAGGSTGSVERPGTVVPLERAMILRALDGSPNNLAAAARCIGWTRQKLYRRMRALGISRKPSG